jgi:hypothetical protein
MNNKRECKRRRLRKAVVDTLFGQCTRCTRPPSCRKVHAATECVTTVFQ